MSSVTIKQLFYECINRDIEIVRTFLHQNPNVVNLDSGDGSLLHFAARHKRVELVKCILDINSEVCSMEDESGCTPLHLASANGSIEIVKLLLNKNQDVCLYNDNFGRNPLHKALMRNGGVLVVTELLRARPEALKQLLDDGETVALLHAYVFTNGPKALEQLVEVDVAIINSQDLQGNTILHKVVTRKKYEILEQLIRINHTNQLIGVNLKNDAMFTASDLIDQIPPDPIMAEMYERLTANVSGNKKVDTFEEIWNAITIMTATLLAIMVFVMMFVMMIQLLIATGKM